MIPCEEKGYKIGNRSVPEVFSIFLESPGELQEVIDSGLIDTNYITCSTDDYLYPTPLRVVRGRVCDFRGAPVEFTFKQFKDIFIKNHNKGYKMEIDIRVIEDEVDIIRFADAGYIENDRDELFIKESSSEEGYNLAHHEIDDLIKALQKAKEIW